MIHGTCLPWNIQPNLETGWNQHKSGFSNLGGVLSRASYFQALPALYIFSLPTPLVRTASTITIPTKLYIAYLNLQYDYSQKVTIKLLQTVTAVVLL